MDWNNWCQKIYKYSQEKGWYNPPKDDLECHAMIHSEIAEATEECRKDVPLIYKLSTCGTRIIGYDNSQYSKDNTQKPEGQAIELMDAVIRVMDWFGYKSWDLSKEMEALENNPYFPHTSIPDKPLVFHSILHLRLAQATGRVLLTSIVQEDTSKQLLAQVIALVQKWFKGKELNFEEILELKYNYNITRSHRHGNKKY